MKYQWLTILLLLSMTSIASAGPSELFMSKKDQLAIIKEEAKELRRELWVSGHTNVDSYSEYMTKEMLDTYMKRDYYQNFEDMLGSDQISDVYKCFYSKSCEVYKIIRSGEMFGGYGSEAFFVMLYTKSGKIRTHGHLIYSE